MRMLLLLLLSPRSQAQKIGKPDPFVKLEFTPTKVSYRQKTMMPFNF